MLLILKQINNILKHIDEIKQTAQFYLKFNNNNFSKLLHTEQRIREHLHFTRA